MIEHGTGTILHPQKTKKKDRLPLAELLYNLPKYPPEKKAATAVGSNSNSVAGHSPPGAGNMVDNKAKSGVVYR